MYKLALVLKPFTGYDTYIAGSYNGSTAAFEAVNLGSIPSPAAVIKNVPGDLDGSQQYEMSSM